MASERPTNQETHAFVDEEAGRTYPTWPEVEECQHLPFPEPSTRSPWRLTSRDFPPYVPLVVGSYGATPLLNLTVQSFSECELRPQQVAAREEFVRTYLNALVLSKAWFTLAPEALKEFEKGRGLKPVKTMAKRLDSALHTMMLHLDDFFFLGALTRPHYNLSTNLQKPPLAKLMTGFGDLKGTVPNRVWNLADVTLRRGAGGWSSVIRLWPKYRSGVSQNSPSGGNSVRTISFERSVASLVHEMVHAYVGMFVCIRSQCHRNLLNTAGLSGHGPTFQKLLTLITEELRTWDNVLQNINEEKCYAGTCVDRINDLVEQRAIEAARSRGELAQYLPLRADSCRTLVRIVNEKLPNGERTSNVIYRPPGSDIPPKADEDPDYVYDEDGDVDMDL